MIYRISTWSEMQFYYLPASTQHYKKLTMSVLSAIKGMSTQCQSLAREVFFDRSALSVTGQTIELKGSVIPQITYSHIQVTTLFFPTLTLSSGPVFDGSLCARLTGELPREATEARRLVFFRGK